MHRAACSLLHRKLHLTLTLSVPALASDALLMSAHGLWAAMTAECQECLMPAATWSNGYHAWTSPLVLCPLKMLVCGAGTALVDYITGRGGGMEAGTGAETASAAHLSVLPVQLPLLPQLSGMSSPVHGLLG